MEQILSVTPLTFGRYEAVAWWSAPGTEQFRPLPGSQGHADGGSLMQHWHSIKLEFSIARDEQLLNRVINEGIVPAHPWEEPVICVAETFSTRMKVDESEPNS